jgi:caffeoyl-CoA O-methyltransferase
MDTPVSLEEIDRYIERLCAPAGDVFEEALRDANRAGLPPIHVSPNEGRLLCLLARMAGARRILELGLLGGYSALWLASALPADGRLVSLEIEPRCIGVARRSLQRAGLLEKVDIRQGPARETLEQMLRSGEAPFDLAFIDADKENYPAYLELVLPMVRPGGLILADNVIRGGAVVRPDATDPGLKAIREFNARLASHPALETILLPILRRSVDGLAIARVRKPDERLARR